MESANKKFKPVTAPLATERAVERGIRLALQLAGLVCVFLAFRVPSPLGIPVAGAGCSAILTLALPGTDRRRRLLQIFAASIALIVAVILLVEGPDSLAKVPVEPTPSSHVVGEMTPPPAVVEQGAPPPAPPLVTPKATEQAESDDTTELAVDVGGVKLPDLGDGNPFEKVAMTQKEMNVFVDAFVEFWSLQKELQGALSRGELSNAQYLEKVVEAGNKGKAELDALMGPERVALLTTELQRYMGTMMMNMDKFDEISEEDLRNQLFAAVQHLAKPPASPLQLKID